MIPAAVRLLLVSVVVLTGCRTAKKAAVTTFRVIDAPARYVRERIDESDGTTTTTTTTTTQGPPVSDVVTPGRPLTNSPLPPAAPTTRRQTVGTRQPASSNVTPRPRADVAAVPQRRPSSSPSPRPAPTQASQFPTAKPVPGKPGYVYSIDPKGGIVDVTGYKSGDKAKDPYTQQIFIVP